MEMEKTGGGKNECLFITCPRGVAAGVHVRILSALTVLVSGEIL